jgi:lysophospholipase L1-like esterase
VGLNSRWAAALALLSGSAVFASVVAIAVVAVAASAAAAPAPTTTTTIPAATTTAPAAPAWQTAWTSAVDFALPGVVAYNLTVRDIAQVAVAGTSIELQLSNTWSDTPTTFGSVTVGADQSGAAVLPGSIVPVTFGGSRSVTIPAGPAVGSVTSDPVAMTVHAGESLAVSLSVVGRAAVSVHYCCEGRVDSYATAGGVGDQTANPAATSFAYSDVNMHWLSAIAVTGTEAQGTVVAFGDSITEGFNNPVAGYGWPSSLQQRITQLPPSQQVAVVNQGITGNTLTVFPPGTTYAATDGGLPGVTRLVPDALSLPGVKDVVLFLGTNDIWFGGGQNTGVPIPPYGTAAAIEAGMQAVIAATHAAGIKIFGVTLLPRSSFSGGNGGKPETWSAADQAVLAAVNAWILSPGNGFDGTINLAAVMGDVYNGACQPTTPFAPYFTEDNLHPNLAGQTVMADAIPTSMFGIPQAPQVPQLLAVTPTRGCAGAVAAERVLALARAPGRPSTTSTPTTQPVGATVSHTGGGHTTAAVLAALGAAIVLLIAALLVVRQRRATGWRRR